MWFVLSESLCLSARSQKRKNHFRSRASVSYVLISSSTFPLSLLVLKRSTFVAKRSDFVYIKNANRFRQSVQNNWLARCSFSSIRVRRWSLHVLVFCNTQLYFLLFEKWHQQLDASTCCKVCKDMTSIYSLEQSLKSAWTWLSTCTFQNILEYSNTLLCTNIYFLSTLTYNDQKKKLTIIFSVWKFIIANLSQIDQEK